jgi:hypothetical protein
VPLTKPLLALNALQRVKPLPVAISVLLSRTLTVFVIFLTTGTDPGNVQTINH